ncbi:MULTISPECIES: hypothetical protein [Paenibacillus]|uniref:hypothetical protein n=1 Tax=Paenibacillus TaxID=44249 RepID=UPI0022B8D72E|nr:hypothetical protein [Paenibacillus caseinilyticus]MCZ8521862.1 hypothetical protein [Paenibacillus caseinilyticus]
MYIKITLLSAAVSLFSLTPIESVPQISRESEALLQRIRTESNHTLTVQWNSSAQSPSLLYGVLTSPSNHSPGWIAYEYLNRIKSLYGLKRVREDLIIQRIDQNESGYTVWLQREFFKKPVCGDRIAVEMDQSGRIHRVEGTLHALLEKKRLGRPMYPAVTVDGAKRIAAAFAPDLRNAGSLHVGACYLPERAGVPLVYVVHYEKEGRPAVLRIHSITGKVID